MKHDGERIVGRIVIWGVALTMATFIVRNIPDLIRYLKIKMM